LVERDWAAELLLLRGENRDEIAARAREAEEALGEASLSAVAAGLAGPAAGWRCLAIVAESSGEAREKLAQARAALEAGEARVWDSKGIYYLDTPILDEPRPGALRGAKLSYLFPGQGSQSVGMLGELRDLFPEIRYSLAEFDTALADRLPAPLSSYIYPPKAATPEEEKAQSDALTATRIAQPALGAVEMGLVSVLSSFGLEPDQTAGHSYGELAALVTAGAFDRSSLARLSETRGRLMTDAAGAIQGTMAALDADRATVDLLIKGIAGVVVANHNAPRQVVISGTVYAVGAVLKRAKVRRTRYRELAVSGAFHSSLVAGALPGFSEALDQTEVVPARFPVYANATGSAYPPIVDSIRRLLGRQLINPVEFVEMIGAMHLDGARVFVEVGPRAVLTGLVGRILGDKPHLAIALDNPNRPGLVPLLQGLGQLAAAGAPVRGRAPASD
jgi:acyl transferase domain-containing protein